MRAIKGSCSCFIKTNIMCLSKIYKVWPGRSCEWADLATQKLNKVWLCDINKPEAVTVVVGVYVSHSSFYVDASRTLLP